MKERSFSSDRVAQVPAQAVARRPSRSGFTLVELLVIITIIAILASLTLFAMFGAQESAREAKTRSLIVRLNDVIMPMYESYKDRSVPLSTGNGFGVPPIVLHRGWGGQYYVPDGTGRNTVEPHKQQRIVGRCLIDAKREMMRLEMPDRWTDIVWTNAAGIPLYGNAQEITDPTQPMQRPGMRYISGINAPPVANSYLRRFDAQLVRLFKSGKSVPEAMELFYENQQAEMLYLIVSIASEDGTEYFQASDAQDVDGDGFREFIDGWGKPISWLRWPAGYDSPLTRSAVGIVTGQPASDEVQGDANLSSTDDTYTGYVLRITNGPSKGQMRYVLDYAGATQTFKISGNLSLLGGERFSLLAPDPFDTQKIYPPRFGTQGDFWQSSQAQLTFETLPIIFSDGPDERAEIVNNLTLAGDQFIYSQFNNNPFVVDANGHMMGTTWDSDGEGDANWIDNITSHDLTRR